MNLSNKTIWITGASSGIGEALAIALCKQQWQGTLILSARRTEELERVKEMCVSQFAVKPENIFLQTLDLSNSETLQLSVDEVLKKCHYVDILINNGGVAHRSLAKDTLLEIDRRIFEVNYFGTITLTKALLPSMMKRKSGQIVVISSVAGKVGTPFRTAYAASKHALYGFFDSLRAEVWADNIKVTMICPGFIKTAISENALLGDGARFGKMDEAQANGMSADVCARLILDAVDQDKEDIAMGGVREKAALFLKRFAPLRLSKIIRTVRVR